VPCVVDQLDPARVEEQIVNDEIAKWPDWQKRTGRIPEAYWDRLSAEWSAAERIVVNSDWSKQALIRQGVDAAKLQVVPLVYESPASAPRSPRNSSAPLQVLWLGQVILRKGIPYLLEAARQLVDENIRFTVAGWVGISESAVKSAPPNVRVVGPVPRLQTAEYYRNADVFVLPTLSDGFALTQLEAMSHGLPVIATPCCGKVVTDGVDGLIIPPADGNALAAAILTLHRDRDRLAAMSAAATQAVTRFTLDRYATAIESVFP
jgi:glycosyltransferase involved in cell wall biosynthesis